MGEHAVAPEPVRLGILGPFDVTRNDAPVSLGPPQQRAVLAVLAVDANHVVTQARLVDALWGDSPHPGAITSIQTHVSRLRQVLEPDRRPGEPARLLVTGHGGYRLAVGPQALDAYRFERLAADGTAAMARSDPTAAVAAYDEALALWRGEVLADLSACPFVAPLAARLGELRAAVEQDRLQARLDLGEHASVVPEVEWLIDRHPLREGLYAQLMTALYRSGRQSDALSTYRRLRMLLQGELGIDPSPAVQQLHRRILEQDPTLLLAHDVPSPRDVARRPAPLAASASGAVVTPRGPPPTAAPAAARGSRPRSRGPIRWGTTVSALVSVALAATVFATAGSDRPVPLPGNSLGVLDGAGRVLAVVPVGTNPTALVYGGGSLWVANQSDDTVMRVDPVSRQVTQTFPVGDNPAALVATRDDLWVANLADDTVSRISIPANRVVQQAIKVGSRPAAIAAGQGGVWVANSGDNTVQRIDAETGRPDAAVGVGDGPSAVLVDDGSLWVANGRDGTISRLTTSSGAEAASPVRVGSGPGAMVRVEDDLWVADLDGHVVSRLGMASGIVTPVEVGDGPTSLAVLDGSVWVSEQYAQRLSRIDPSTNERTGVPLTASPRGLVAVGGRLWVATGAGTGEHRGGTLTIATDTLPGQDPGIDPATVYDPYTHQAVWVVYHGLVSIRYSTIASQVLVPDLAVRLPLPSEGGRTYTFELRPGIRYSTGAEVKASDIVRGVERAVAFGAAPHLMAAVRGAASCSKKPDRCQMSAGVVADDAERRVTFRLTRPDPAFLAKLAVLVYPVPPGDWGRPSTVPIPGTGPYRISRYVKGQAFELGRNPYFRPWSVAAAPDGYPDIIRWLKVKDVAAAAAAVDDGRADLTDLVAFGGHTEIGRLVDELRVRQPTKVHFDQGNLRSFWSFNVSRPPFDNRLARQAVNYAVDRRAMTELGGGSLMTQPSCQLLVPGFPGYRPYCPYTEGPQDGTYHAPDLAKAKELVARSGTKGMRVTMIDVVGDSVSSSYEEYLAGVLRTLGYAVDYRRLPKTGANLALVHTPTNSTNVQGGGWGPDYPSSYAWYEPLVSCRNEVNRYCEPERDARAAAAAAASDPARTQQLWTAIDREVTEDAPLVWGQVFAQWWYASSRLGNFQSNRWFGPLLSQFWVR